MTYYYDADDSTAHADIDTVYPEQDHPELSDVQRVNGVLEVPDGATVYGEGFDVERFGEQDYRTRAEQVREGEVDDHLDAIEAAETADTVLTAIEDRREERGD